MVDLKKLNQNKINIFFQHTMILFIALLSFILSNYTIVHAQNGDIDLARLHLQNFLEQRPEIRSLKDYEKVVPTICKDYVMEGLKKAGLTNSA